jgi:nucleolar protein 53
VPKDKIQVQGEKEVADSLRRIKPKGNLLRDRYLSLLQRNIIEPRSRVRYVYMLVNGLAY